MVEFYPEIRLAHIAAVIASGGLFAVRGVMLFSGIGLALLGPLRYLSYAVDTILLTAALMLMTIVQQYPLVHGWLTVKVVFLVVYIVLGVFAFRKVFAYGTRIGCWVAALIVFLFIVSVARAHDPLGFLSALVS